AGGAPTRAVVVEATQRRGVVGKTAGLGDVVGAGVHQVRAGGKRRRAVGVGLLLGDLVAAGGGADVQRGLPGGARPDLVELDRALVAGVGEGAHDGVGGAHADVARRRRHGGLGAVLGAVAGGAPTRAVVVEATQRRGVVGKTAGLGDVVGAGVHQVRAGGKRRRAVGAGLL